jgi:hypothetical protein
MFVNEAGAYPSEAGFMCSTQRWASVLTRKYQTSLKRPARDKHSSILRLFVNYVLKFFITLGSGASFTTLYFLYNLRMVQ